MLVKPLGQVAAELLAPYEHARSACSCRPWPVLTAWTNQLVSSSALFPDNSADSMMASVVSSGAIDVPARASWVEARSFVAIAPLHAHATASRGPQKVRMMVAGLGLTLTQFGICVRVRAGSLRRC
jgi:hypothetical protein